MVEIKATNLNVFFDRNHIIKNLNLKIMANKITAIIGPNGSGKSTLLKSLSGLIKPKSGEILIDNHAINRLSRKQLARKISFLMQNPAAPENITVKDLVSLGRFSHQKWLGPSSKDHEQINWAIKQVNLENKMNHSLAQLSGGQQKRAWIAMALAQDSHALLLDEPTNFLDIRHQLETLFILRKLNLDCSKTIVVVLHDIQQVFQFVDYLIILDEGRLIYHDEINADIDTKIFEEVFGIKVKLLNSENNQRIIMVNGLIQDQTQRVI